jgi:hypothetical protein
VHLRRPTLYESSLQQCPQSGIHGGEVVTLSLDFYKLNCIDGLLLSFGIIRHDNFSDKVSLAAFFPAYTHIASYALTVPKRVTSRGRLTLASKFVLKPARDG